MVDLAEIQTAYYMVAATGVLVAAVYYVMNMRATLQTRQAQLFMPIYAAYSSDEMAKAYTKIQEMEFKNYDEFMERYGPNTDPEAFLANRKVNNWFEGIGVLVKRGLISPGFVDDLMSGVTIRYWEKFRSYYLEYRVRNDWPQSAEHVEYLYNQIKPIAERQKRELKVKAQ